jgi:hypothetical protein
MFRPMDNYIFYRVYSRGFFGIISFQNNSNDLIFTIQILIQIIRLGYYFAEISCPTRYLPEAFTRYFLRSLIYGIGVIQKRCNSSYQNL